MFRKEKNRGFHPLKVVALATVLFMITAGLLAVYVPEETTGEYDMTNVVAMWKMNEGTGTTAYDETDNDNDGTLQNG